MASRASVAFALSFVLVARAAAQDATDPGVHLAWVRGEGAEGCVSATALTAEVIRRLGRNPFHEPVTQTIEGVARRIEDGSFVAELYNRDASALLAARRFTSAGPDCAALGSAVALAVALAIDPEAAMRTMGDAASTGAPDASDVDGGLSADAIAERDAERAASDSSASAAAPEPLATEASAETSVEPVTPPAASAATPTERDATPSARIRLGANASYQLVPGFAPGVELVFDGRIVGPVRFMLGMLYVPEQRTSEPTADFGFGVTAARAGVCAVSFGMRFAGGGCATLSFGAIHAVVYRPSPTSPGDRFFGALDVSVEGSIVVVAPLFVAGSMGVSVPLERHEFRVIGRDSIEFEQSAAIPTASIHAGMHFP